MREWQVCPATRSWWYRPSRVLQAIGGQLLRFARSSVVDRAAVRGIERLTVRNMLDPCIELSEGNSALVKLYPFRARGANSFTIAPNEGLFRYFDYGHNNSSVAFVVRGRGLSFDTTIRFVTEGRGVPMRCVDRRHDRRRVSRTERQRSLLAILSTIRAFFLRGLETASGRRDLSTETCTCNQ